MSPPKPPRPGSGTLVVAEDVVQPGAVNDYREPSFGERPTVPPIPHDTIPRARAVPRKPTQRGMPAPASEQRPPMSNPPPEDEPPMQRPRARQASQRDVSFEADSEDRPSVVDFQHEVRANYGKASFAGPAWVFMVLLVAGLLGTIVYLLARRPEPPAQSAQCLTKDQFDESMRIRDERTARRFDTLETDTSYLKVALRLLQDRQQPAK